MNSNNGDLYFKAGIDLDDFKAGADAMERRMKHVTDSIVHDASEMDDALLRVGSAFIKIAGIGSAGAFVKQMFNVRSEMQNTEAMLRVFLGSAEKANDFFKSLQGYAYNNVFEFADLAKQSAQLLAYKTNVEDVIPTLNKLSEIAAGTNAPLESLVSVFNKVKANDRLGGDEIRALGNMGIDVYQTIADMKVLNGELDATRDSVKGTKLDFEDLQKVIDHVTTNGGMYEGMMAEKMKTLGDTLGLMQDNITNMFNELGEQTQGWLKAGMDVANFMIEHYADIASVLGTLVVTYGAVKAANIAMSLAQKSGTGVAVLDNTTRAIQAKLLQIEITSRKNVTKSIEAQRAAQQQEIATLQAAMTEHEHAAMIDDARVKALDNILTSQQKAQLVQLGLISSTGELTSKAEDYLPIATSMLDKEQQLQFAQSELSNNNQAYIDSMRDIVGMNGDVANTIDDRIENATKLLSLSEDELSSANAKVTALENEVQQYKDLSQSLSDAGDATGAQEAAEIAETTAATLETAKKNAETAAEVRNTRQRQLNELQTRKQSTANLQEATSTTIATKAKMAFTNVVKLTRAAIEKLWMTIKANPLGLIIAAITAVVSAMSFFIRKHKEAKEAEEEHNNALAKFNAEVDNEIVHINNLITTIDHSSKGTKAYTKAMQELNKICEDYNVTAFNALEPIRQQTEAYNELTAAIREKIAAKILEKAHESAQADKEERDTDLIKDFTKDMKGRKTHYGYKRFDVVRDFFSDDEYANQRDLFMTAMLGEAEMVANGMSTADEAVKKLGETFMEFTGKSMGKQSLIDLREQFDLFVDSAKQAKDEVDEASKVADAHARSNDSDSQSTKTLKERTAELNKQIKDLKANLKSLRDPKAQFNKNTEKDIKDTEDELKKKEKELQTLTGKSTKSGNDTAKKRKEYAMLQAKNEALLQYEIEDARIAAMQDGAEKQMAQMKNNHDRAIKELEYERKEIDKKRKELGLGSINWNETDESKMGAEQKSIQQKQNKINQTYNQQMKSVYDGEVDRMRKLYDQYSQWVETLGADMAKKRFEKLLPQGENYRVWLTNTIENTEKQIDAITDKDSPERDALLQYLYQLQAAANEFDGAETPAAKFLRELNEQIDNAANGGEKLSILNKELERLKKNDPSLKLTANQIDALIVQLRLQVQQTQREIERAFTQKYLSFVSNRQQQVKQYQQEIKKLRDLGRTEQANALEQAMTDAIGEADKDFIKGFLHDVFGSNQTKKGIKDAYKQLEKMRTAIANSLSTGDKSGLAAWGLTDKDPQHLQELLDRIQEVKEEVEDIDPDTGLAVALRNIRDGLKEDDADKLKKGIDKISDAYSKFTSVVSSLSDALSNLAEATDNENLKNTAKTVSRVTDVISTGASWAQIGNSIGGGMGAAIGAIAGIVLSGNTAIAEANQEYLQKVLDATESGNEALEHTGNLALDILNAVVGLRETVASLNYGDFHSSLLDLIGSVKKSMNDYKSPDSEGRSFWTRTKDALNIHSLNLMAQDLEDSGYLSEYFMRYTNGQTGGDYYRQAVEYARENIMRDKLSELGWSDEEIDKVINKVGGNWDKIGEALANHFNHIFSVIYDEQTELVEELTKLYKNGSYDSIAYYNTTYKAYQLQIRSIQALLEIAKLEGDTEAVVEYENQLAQLGYEMSSAFQQFAESLYGIGFEDLIDNWISIFEEFGDNVEGAFAKMDESIDQMFVNMLKKRLIVEPMMEYFDELIKKYTNEEGDITDEVFESLLGDLHEGKNTFLDKWNALNDKLRQEGLSLYGASDTSSLTGSIQNLSEETGGVFAGRMNAMVMNQAETTSVLRQSLLEQHEMNNHLTTIENDLATIKRSMTSNFNPNVNYGYSEY